MKDKEIIIISLGGSLIVPDSIDIEFLKEFKKLILKHIKNKYFILITGGGRTARNYQNAAKQLHELTDEDADWIGINATRLNARLVRTMFAENIYDEVILDPTKKIIIKNSIYVAAGWKPGYSTDYDAVLLAKNLNAKTIINLSNTDYVYDKDPKKYSNAKKIVNISWKDFRKMVGSKWIPGLNVPFDPIASKLAEKLKLKVIIANGKDILNLNNLFNKKSFIGTTIQ
jgi:uridylate kinase